MDSTSGNRPYEVCKSRASKRARRHSLQIPLRYRIPGKQEWAAGETINLSESGILFSAEHIMEVNTRLEVTFQSEGIPLPRSGTRAVQIVRRVLSNWPDTRPMFGARFCS
jgi:PilZ domain-containing protein